MKLNYNVNVKQEIAAEAARLFARYGIKNITMDELASNLGVSKKTIYIWYRDKNELVQEVYLPILKEMENAFEVVRANATDAIAEIVEAGNMLRRLMQNICDMVMRDIEKYYPSVSGQFEIVKKEAVYKGVCDNINRGKKENLYRADVQTDQVALHFLSVMETLHNRTSGRHAPENSLKSQDVLLYYLHGLVTPLGLTRLQQYEPIIEKTNCVI